MLFCQSLKKCQCTVGCFLIVSEDNLKILIRLAEKRFKKIFDIWLCVVNRDDYTN